MLTSGSINSGINIFVGGKKNIFYAIFSTLKLPGVLSKAYITFWCHSENILLLHTPAHNASLQVLCNIIKINNAMKPIAVNKGKAFKKHLLAT